MDKTPKVNYMECSRGGYHFGEALNMVNIDAKSDEPIMLCCACVEEDRKQPSSKPLRQIMLESSKAIAALKPAHFNIDIALGLVKNHRAQAKETYQLHREHLLTHLSAVEKSIEEFYYQLSEQVRRKNIDPKIEIEAAFQNIYQPKNLDTLEKAVRKITGLIKADKSDKELNQKDIMEGIKASNEAFQKRLKSAMDASSQQLERSKDDLTQAVSLGDIWKQSSFKFSTQLKHSDIKVVSDSLVKSFNSSGYKFSVMTPALEASKSVKRLAFRIKECSSNWVAVGVCHQSIVASKNYGFNFSSIGHGGYLVSANGGIWNHGRSDQNNAIKGFKFTKGDIITVEVQPGDGSIVFRRNKDSYTINYDVNMKEGLSPCALFYYLNDEVEFLPDYQW